MTSHVSTIYKTCFVLLLYIVFFFFFFLLFARTINWCVITFSQNKCIYRRYRNTRKWENGSSFNVDASWDFVALYIDNVYCARLCDNDDDDDKSKFVYLNWEFLLLFSAEIFPHTNFCLKIYLVKVVVENQLPVIVVIDATMLVILIR